MDEEAIELKREADRINVLLEDNRKREAELQARLDAINLQLAALSLEDKKP